MSSSARLTSSSGSSSSGSSSSAPLPLPLPQRSKPCTPSVCSTPPSLLSPLETLLQLGVPRERALKALVATGHRGVQIASDWLLSHVKDPSLDSKQPRHFVVYLCPVGKLLDQLQTFWDASHIQIGWNGAHNSFPHITLTSSFPCPDEQVEVLLEKVKKVCGDFQQDFDSGSFKLEKYVSPNFFGLFVGKKEEILLRSFSQELSQAFQSVGIDTEPMTKAYHVTLAYQFAPAHCAGLEDLVARVDPACSCDWQVRVYSFEERSKNHDVFKVLFAHIPREEDELELMIGDHVYVTPEEVAGSTDGWLVGTSWLTGCQGYLPKNYIQQTAETNSWTSHLTLPMTTVQASVQDSHKPSSRTSSCSSSLERLKGKNHSSSLNRQNDSKLTTTTTTTDGNEPPTAATAVEVLEERGEEIRIQRISEPRRVFVVRHGERVDFTFGSWIPYCFDEKGTYKQKDLNMPVSVPQRKSGPEGFLRDCPLTCIGLTQATLLGEALKAAGVSFSHAFVSPSLRCIQTCHNILKGLGLQQSIKMNIEPGIFEWLAWHQNAMPDWIGPEELLEAGYNIDCKYKPYISAEELQDTEETSEQYFTRNFFVTQCILQSTEGLGGNLLFVAHASSLDTCTRQIVGEAPRAMTELMQVVRKVPYCAMSVIEEGGNRGGAGKKDGRKDKFSWKLVDPPVPPMTHCSNARFNWELLTDSGGQATQGLKNRQDPRAKGENTSMEF